MTSLLSSSLVQALIRFFIVSDLLESSYDCNSHSVDIVNSEKSKISRYCLEARMNAAVASY